MNFSFLKEIYDRLPYAVKAPFAGFIRKKITKNPLFLKEYHTLQECEAWTREQIQQEQFKRLKNTLIHAYEHTKYYHNLFDSISLDPHEFKSTDELKRIPVLTKSLLSEHFEELKADDVPESYLVTTGGTSGKPVALEMSNDAYYLEWAYVYHFWSKFGYDFETSKLATFRGIKLGSKLSVINPLNREIRLNIFALNHENVKEYYKRIKRYGGEFLYGYPTAIYHFCKLAQEAGINLKGSFQAVLLISENLYSFQEETIKAALDCPIGMFYGHTERALFAERLGKEYHFHPLYGFTEFSENQEPIATAFLNQKMPLIRYLVDDQVSETDEGYQIVGHFDKEVLYGLNGEEISAAAINFHDHTFDKINAMQFIQAEKGICELHVVCKERLTQDDLEKMEKSVFEKFGESLKCKAKQVDHVELTGRGKVRLIVYTDAFLDAIKRMKQA